MARPENFQKALPAIKKILSRFSPYLRKHRLLTGGSFLALFAEVGLRLLEPWPLKFIIDRVVDVGPSGGGSSLPFVGRVDLMNLLAICALAVVVIIGLRALAAYASTIGFALIGNQVLTEVRQDLYRHLQRLSLSFHNKAKGGDMTVRVIGDIGLLKDVIVSAFLPMLGNILVLVGMMTVMLILNWQLALLALATLPIFALSTVRLGGSIHGVSRKQRKREGEMAAMTSESLGSMKAVQALSMEGSFEKAFASQNDKSLTEGVEAKKLATRLERGADLMIGISTALVLYFGARIVIAGALTPGDLLVFLTYLKNAFKPVRDFAKYTGRIAKATAAGERILDLMDRKSDIENLPGSRPAPALRGDVRFENVSFAYEPGQPVLEGVDFGAAPGQQVAIVGSSGNGKSTLASLLLRLYDPTEGRVMIDGQDIRDYTLESLRPQISAVLQDSLLFAANIRENIANGAPDATPEEIEAAARLANAHEFIEALPEGYDTAVGERGVTLSGGQRQRLAIARAAVRKAPILLLDEPTTGLDKENERKVIDALEKLAEDRTTFVITHDLHLASRADSLIYVEGGRVLERGTHEELMRAGGRYATLYGLQAVARDTEAYDRSPDAFTR